MAFDWSIWATKVLTQIAIVGIPVIVTLMAEIPAETAGVYVTIIAAVLIALQNWLKHRNDD